MSSYRVVETDGERAICMYSSHQRSICEAFIVGLYEMYEMPESTKPGKDANRGASDRIVNWNPVDSELTILRTSEGLRRVMRGKFRTAYYAHHYGNTVIKIERLE